MSESLERKPELRWLTAIVVVYALANLAIGMSGGFSGSIGEAVTPFMSLAFAAFIFMHGKANLGLRNVLLLIVMGSMVGLFYEALSMKTGFPYSAYYYTDFIPGPKLLGFPVLAMVNYGIGGYIFWSAAQAVLGRFNNSLRKSDVIFIPLIASFLQTSWDYVLDPLMATISRAYIWENPGPFYGIPFANYMGWYLATYTLFQIFAIILYGQQRVVHTPYHESRGFWYLPIAMYASLVAQLPLLVFTVPNERIINAAGQVFDTHDIYQGVNLMGIAVILFPAILGIARIFNSTELEAPKDLPKPNV